MLSVCAVLAFSGCYARVHYPGPPITPGYKSITIKKWVSDQIIFGCTAAHGTGSARAFCALDTIHDLCRGIRVSGITEDDCSDMSSYGEWENMEGSIEWVTGPERDCLNFWSYPSDSPVDETWWAQPLGYDYCE